MIFSFTCCLSACLRATDVRRGNVRKERKSDDVGDGKGGEGTQKKRERKRMSVTHYEFLLFSHVGQEMLQSRFGTKSWQEWRAMRWRWRWRNNSLFCSNVATESLNSRLVSSSLSEVLQLLVLGKHTHSVYFSSVRCSTRCRMQKLASCCRCVLAKRGCTPDGDGEPLVRQQADSAATR